MGHATGGSNIRSDTGDVTIIAAGSVTGNVTLDGAGNVVSTNYYGANNIASAGLKIDLRDDKLLTVTAGGDVAIEQGAGFGTSTDRKLRIGAITTPGDVLIKAWGSVVAGDPTATVDQEKLARFLAAAKSLQLTPDCAATNCGIVDPVMLGEVDRSVRNDAYAAYDKLGSADTKVYDAAVKTLTEAFGFVPASRGAIATAAIKLKKDHMVAYQLRNQGRDAYNVYALTNAAATAEDSRGIAVGQTVAAIDKIAAFGAKGGLSLSSDGAAVSGIDITAETLVPGGELYRLAVAALASKSRPISGDTASEVELKAGLQLYLDDLRAPVASLLPAGLLDFTGKSEAEKITAVSDAITGNQLAGWVEGQNLVTQRSRASADALGKLEQIAAFRANTGITVSADARTVTVSDAAFASDTSLQDGGPLYNLALATLRAQVNSNGLREKVPLPTNDDVRRGLSLYLSTLRTPLDDLLPGALPVLATNDASASLRNVAAAITDTGLKTWADKLQVAAAAELTQLFGTTAVTKSTVATVAFAQETLDKRLQGSTWSQTQLDVQVPSTAFVPVADSQIASRKPVITARGVTLVAGNSIGDFDAQNTFRYTSAGYAGSTNASGGASGVSKDLAQAYLASSGPGDLKTVIEYTNPGDATSAVKSISFTTRRDQPLQLDASGIVNAVAGVNIASIAANGSSASANNATVQSGGANIRGDIFFNNSGTLTLGSVVSEKVRTGDTSIIPCDLGGDAAALCASRVRIVASDIIGTVSGAARVTSGSTLLSNGDGSALVMGGLVRMEASNGSIVGQTGNAIAVDTTALEVLRAAGTISLTRRAPAFITGTYNSATISNSATCSPATSSTSTTPMDRSTSSGCLPTWRASAAIRGSSPASCRFAPPATSDRRTSPRRDTGPVRHPGADHPAAGRGL